MLEILRRSAKLASREGAVRTFSRNTELLTAPALRVLPPSLGKCAKYCEGQQKWAQARTQFWAPLQADPMHDSAQVSLGFQLCWIREHTVMLLKA